MIGIGGHHAALDALQPAPQPLLMYVEVSQHAALVVEVHGQHTQCVAGSCICKFEDIKLPVSAGILHSQTLSVHTSVLHKPAVARLCISSCVLA